MPSRITHTTRRPRHLRLAVAGMSLAAVAALGAGSAHAQSLGALTDSLDSGSLDSGSLDSGSLGSLIPGGPSENDGLYTGEVEVVDGEAADPNTLTGHVFDDANKNSRFDEGEVGVPGVQVSNGIDVVTTDENGAYELPAEGDFTAFVSQPAGWQVPVDEQSFVQFSYNHYPEGSPELKFGGLEPTGPLPAAVNFPLAKSEATADPKQTCPIATDTQTYDKQEVEWARKGAVADLMAREDYASCGILLTGDNVGDDLSLNPDLRDLYAEANGPVRALPGNHDMDFDAPGDENSLDTYRRDFGAPYYSYNVGNVHFVALDNIVYNGADDEGGNGGYSEAISEEQLEWLAKDLAQVDKNQPIVIAAHAPIIDYRDVTTDNAAELYEILADYPNAVTIGGHTHTLEHLVAGDRRAEWAEAGIPELTHDQLVAGAVSGSWYSGELNDNGVPHAYTSDAAEPGVLTVEFDGDERSEYYTVRNEDQDHQFLTAINSPAWREWAEAAQQWQDDDKQGPAPEQFDITTVDAADLAGGESYLTTSFFSGSTAADVQVTIDGEAMDAEHTQPNTGESLNKGWEFTDPVSATHNLSSDGAIEQASPHLWRVALPTDLEAGEHTVEITGTDRYGTTYTETFTFTVTGGENAADTQDEVDAQDAVDTQDDTEAEATTEE